MALITLRQLLDHAGECGYGVPAFNVNNMEQVIAIMDAAVAENAPVIIQASRGALKYARQEMLAAMVFTAVKMYPNIPVCLHLDHGNSPASCIKAIQLGFTSVMMDGSLDEAGKSVSSYDYNVTVTSEVVKIAHSVGVSVEGEIGVLGSLESCESAAEDGHGAMGKLNKNQLLTNPDEAVDFVKKTNVDALAIAMGTSHGAYKFSRQPDENILSVDLVKIINKRLPNTHLVMHGSSSVPLELVEEFNKYGGNMPKTWGVPIDEIVKCIKCGVRKVNIDTDNRLAMSGAVRKILASDSKEFDIRKYLKPATEAMTKVCRERLEAFGCSGMAGKINPKSNNEMAKSYN